VGHGSPPARTGRHIILTTHYIEEAEEMADRIGVINKGEIVVVEEKHALMRKLGRTTVTIGLKQPLQTLRQRSMSGP